MRGEKDIIRLRLQGYSVGRIAELYDLASPYVRGVLRARGLADCQSVAPAPLRKDNILIDGAPSWRQLGLDDPRPF